MKLTHEKVIVILYIITLLTAVASRTIDALYFAALFILLLSAVKFFLVFFQFMDMKHSNSFWKTVIILYLTAFVGAIGVILRM